MFTRNVLNRIRSIPRIFQSQGQQVRYVRIRQQSVNKPLWKSLAKAAGAIVGVGAGLIFASKRTKACGIIGVVGPPGQEHATPFLLEGLTILQNRGYDSAGISTIHQSGTDNSLSTTKMASIGASDSIDQLKKAAPDRHSGDTVGVAHTRWATHGAKTDENSHPHEDQSQTVAVVHNGTIENYAELKAELEKEGVVFKSQTDTEVIAQLIGRHLKNGGLLVDAVRNTVTRLRGTWGLAVMSRDEPDRIVVARHGSPLVIGLGEKRAFVASEPIAFARHTRRFIRLHDGQIATVKADGSGIDLSQVEEAPDSEPVELTPSGFFPGTKEKITTWLLKEIVEQPESTLRALAYGGRFTSDASGVKLGGLDASAFTLDSIKDMILTGCGTSLYGAMYGAKLMRWMGGPFRSVAAVDSAELVGEMLPVRGGGMLCLSQSGETKDALRALELAEGKMPRLSIVNKVGSAIASTTGCGVYLNAGRENSVASTKSFTSQVTVLGLVAAWFAQRRIACSGPSAPLDCASEMPAESVGEMTRRVHDLVQNLSSLPTLIGMTLQRNAQCRDLATRLKGTNHMFILGKGFAEPVALEAALKIKEVARVHAEGFSGGALKHGPFALLEPGTPVILFVLNDQHGELMRVAAQETKARGAHNIVITDSPHLARGIAAPEDTFLIPRNGPLTALLGVVPMQLLAFHMAHQNPLIGLSLDTPRNLAKAVTVD
jgi:glucosamine--fructose-6-phosphate aminotransferase (isomerizing)